MHNLKVIGFDFGMKRIGMAVGQSISNTASPLSTLSARDGVPNWQDLERVLKDWHPNTLVVGLPKKIDGTEQHTTFAAKKFAKKLKRYQLPIHLVDERLTTVEARALAFEQGGYQQLKQSQIDSLAAVLIVEQWLMEQV